MKHIDVRLFLICLSAVFTAGCQDLGGIEGEGEWALYRLSDTTLTSYDIGGQDISTLRLAPVPFLTARDIAAYHWKSHTIEFTWQAEATMDSFAMPHRGSTRGRPFVVTVGSERVYLGTFWWAFSSSMPGYPYLEVTRFDSRSIELPPLFTGADPRADRRIYWALKMAGVLVED